jgi:SAM-dependent methyltransferase
VYLWRRIRRKLLRLLPRELVRRLFAGSRHYCPVCESSLSRFLSYDRQARTLMGYALPMNAVCPVCGSLERHRLTWLFLNERTDLFSGRPKRVLHMAPERQLEARLRAVTDLDYVSADLADPHVTMRFDVTRIPLEDDSFDVVLCSHVLEHVQDDERAMRELARILRPDGWAILEVPPLRRAVTFEDPSIQDAKDRERVFGQRDHVRLVGEDYPHRLEQNGWIVQRFRADDVAGTRGLGKFGLIAEEDIFYCRPRASTVAGSRESAEDWRTPAHPGSESDDRSVSAV